MAKVSGPLMSLEASGTYANALTFAKWKGRPYVRLRVDPANPQSLNQMKSRGYMAVAAAAVRWANNSTQKQPGVAELDKVLLRDAAPSGQAWNGFLTKSMLGAGSTVIVAAMARWDGITAPQKAAWEATAATMTPVWLPVPTYIAEGEAGPVISPGEVFFLYLNGLSVAGVLDAAMVDTVPTEYDPA